MVAKQTFDARVYCPHKTAHEKAILKLRANTDNTERPTSLSVLLKVGVQGLRSFRNRSILCVCEDFGSKRNAAITF